MKTSTQWGLLGGVTGGLLGFYVGKSYAMSRLKVVLTTLGGATAGGGIGYGFGRYTHRRQLLWARGYWQAKGDKWMVRDIDRALRDEPE